MRLCDIMALRRIFEKRKNEILSVRLSIKLLKFKNATEAEAEIYTARVVRILQACAQTDENGNFLRSDDGGILLKKTRAEDYHNQMKELDESESDVDFCLTNEEAEEMKLTLEEFEVILDFITEGGDGNG